MLRKYVQKICSKWSSVRRAVEVGVDKPGWTIRRRESLSDLWLLFDFSKITIQRFTVDTKRVSSLVLVPTCLLENLADVFFFHFVQGQSPFHCLVDHAPIATGPLNR